MKYFLFLLLCFSTRTRITAQQKICEKIIVITIDGVRWQEVFNGADSTLLFKKGAQSTISSSLYWNKEVTQNRKLLMPFTWSYIATHGQLYGNRNYGNKMQVKNLFRFSYAGYNEIFTGFADNSILGNKPKNNGNNNVLAFLNSYEKNKDSIVVFTSWNLFPYIFNSDKNKLKMNSGYHSKDTALNYYNEFEKNINDKPATRKDALTFMAAKEYLITHKPKIMHIGFGEADEFAHEKQYNNYLSNINMVDKMIGELWDFVENDTDYKDKTIMIITTDHGRGSTSKNWDKHGILIPNSQQTWMAVLGCCITPSGEMTKKNKIYNAQLAQTIADLFGKKFTSNNTIAKSVTNLLIH
jgi:hypothetical protein